MSDPLVAVYAKLGRAEIHLKALQDQVATFLDSEPYGIREHFHPDKGSYCLTIEVRHEPPLLLSVILGDLIHNLRSALDHLAWQLVLANNSEPTKRTQFPIFTSDPVSGEPLNKLTRNVKGMDKTVVDELRRIQPHTAGDRADHHSLAILAKLSNEDKHRLPIACFGAIGPHNPQTTGIVAGRDIQVRWANISTGKALKDGDEVVWARFDVTGPNPEIDMKGKVPIEVAFGHVQARLGGLVDLCRQARSVVALMALTAGFPTHD